jgi:hypothetical protein
VGFSGMQFPQLSHQSREEPHRLSFQLRFLVCFDRFPKQKMVLIATYPYLKVALAGELSHPYYLLSQETGPKMAPSSFRCSANEHR